MFCGVVKVVVVGFREMRGEKARVVRVGSFFKEFGCRGKIWGVGGVI